LHSERFAASAGRAADLGTRPGAAAYAPAGMCCVGTGLNMRRIAIVGGLLVVGLLIVRARLPKLHQRLMARCDEMFERASATPSP
jgi:hypothetical protein